MLQARAKIPRQEQTRLNVAEHARSKSITGAQRMGEVGFAGEVEQK